MSRDTIEYICRTFGQCVTRSRGERGCSFQLDGIDRKSVVIIHGSKYQKKYKFQNKLCDRVVFWDSHCLNLAAVELKGGKTVRLSQAMQQIQNGLSVATNILGNRRVEEWLPVLLYSGSMHPQMTKVLLAKSVEFRGTRKNVVKRRCGTRLDTLVSS